jgi:hypothetical protein
VEKRSKEVIYHLLILVNFITLSLLVGGLFFVNVAVTSTFTTLTTNHYAEFHHILDRYCDPYMPILTFSTALLAIGELWFAQPTWQIVSRLFGIVSILGVALISILVHGPVNRRIRTWRPDIQLDHLQELRLRWVVGHQFRTGLAFVGLVALFLPVIFSF